MRKKKPFIKKKRATLKKNFLSYNFKKQPKNEQFLGRKQINVLKQWKYQISKIQIFKILKFLNFKFLKLARKLQIYNLK